MRGRWAASSVSPVQRVSHFDCQPCEQQASPAARTATAALNWCLRSGRIRRVPQGRTSLPYATPLLLVSSADGCGAGHLSNDEGQGQIHQGIFPSSNERLPGAGHQESVGQVRPAFWSSSARSSSLGQARPALCLLPMPGQRQQRLAAVAKQPSQGWQTSAVDSQLNTKHSASMPRSAPSSTETANPSVKGTSCANAHAAPYVER